MRKRWGIQVIAIAMLIVGLIVFLLGILPPILLATRGAGASWQALLALPTVLAGCSGALLLLAFGSLLLTLVKISENAAARSWKPEARGVLVALADSGLEPAEERPVVETGAAAVVAVAEAEALAGPAQEVETGTGMPAVVAAGMVAAGAAGHEAPRSQTPGRGLGEASVAPVDMVRPPGEGVEVGEVAGPVEGAAPAVLAAGVAKTPQEEVEDLKAQLAALDAQLAEVREYPAGPDESLPPLEIEEPSQEAMVEPAQAAEAGAVTPEVVPAVVTEAAMEAMAEPAEAVETAPPWSEEGEAEEVVGPVEEAPKPSTPEVTSGAVPPAPGVDVEETPPEDVDALRAQLGALEAQLAELGEHPASSDESLSTFETEEPPLDAHAPPKLPGSDDMARIAAEMASLKPGPTGDTPGE